MMMLTVAALAVSNPQDPPSEERMNQIMDLQQNLGQRVFERGRSVLQPNQLSAFGTFESNQLSMHGSASRCLKV